MFDKYRSKAIENPELNLIPVMNLMVVLIPLLLVGAAFFHIAVIPTTTAKEGGRSGEPAMKITLKLQVTPDQLVLSGHTGDKTVDVTTLAGVYPAVGGKYDLKSLQAKLKQLKAKHPTSDTCVITPYDELPYQALVHVVDTVRHEMIPQDEGDPKRIPLFPTTVFARHLPEPELTDDELLERVGFPAIPQPGGAP